MYVQSGLLIISATHLVIIFSDQKSPFLLSFIQSIQPDKSRLRTKKISFLSLLPVFLVFKVFQIEEYWNFLQEVQFLCGFVCRMKLLVILICLLTLGDGVLKPGIQVQYPDGNQLLFNQKG